MREFWKLIHRYGDKYSNAIIYIAFVIVSLIVALMLFGILQSSGIVKLASIGVVQGAEFGGAFAGFLITLIFLVTSYNHSFSDKRQTIVGNVFFDDNQPVKGAIVFVEGVDRQKETDATGWFEIEVNEQPAWSVRVTFQRQTSQSTVARNQIDKPLRLTLPHSSTPDSSAANNSQTRTANASSIAIQEIIEITEEYIVHVREALYPNEISDFLAKGNLPTVPRPLEWWESVFVTGCGPRGIPIVFLSKEKALHLLSLSARLNPTTRSSSQDDQVTALID